MLRPRCAMLCYALTQACYAVPCSDPGVLCSDPGVLCCDPGVLCWRPSQGRPSQPTHLPTYQPSNPPTKLPTSPLANPPNQAAKCICRTDLHGIIVRASTLNIRRMWTVLSHQTKIFPLSTAPSHPVTILSLMVGQAVGHTRRLTK